MILCTVVMYTGVVEEYKNLSCLIGGVGAAGSIFCTCLFQRMMKEFKDELQLPYEYEIIPYKAQEEEIKVQG